MQYHMNGFRPGDPSIARTCVTTNTDASTVDVLIVGCGPAGLTLAAQLSAFPDLHVRIVDRKPGPLKVGQADGIACRSIEMFQAFGFADKVLREAYRVNEVAFWRPDANGGGLNRADRIQDVEHDLSEMPHAILNQARIHDFYLETMKNGARRLQPDYKLELNTLSRSNDADYPVIASFDRLDTEHETEIVRARYVVGCDGARSKVRNSLGLDLKGESARQLWGVMDVLAVTNFPDIRLKAAIQSSDQGSILVIPREGGYMVRMYIELDDLLVDERAADRKVSPEMLIDKARAILNPFTLDVKELAWWSAYEIGQRVCDTFDDVPDEERNSRTPRVFIAGDACHTHSPKAGQGMNVSMADTFNLGWKLASVLRGQASPALLHTYSEERQAKARELIDFDKDMARLFSAKPRNAAEASQFQQYFAKHGRYTAGVETRYDSSVITTVTRHQSLATGLTIGMRFHSAPVIRLADGKPMQLGHTLKADGRWRLIAFAPAKDTGQPESDIDHLCNFLMDDPDSPIRQFTSDGADIDSVIELLAVFQSSHRRLKLEELPALLFPAKGIYGLTDYEKVFCAAIDSNPDIFDLRGIDRSQGALLVIRPDQFVSAVMPLNAFAGLIDFFRGFLIRR